MFQISTILTKSDSQTAISTKLAYWLERSAFYLLLALIVWVPIPLGSNRPWAWSLMEVIVMIIAYLWFMSMILHPRPLPLAVTKAKVPLILFVSWLGYLFLQTVPLPANIISFINPAGYNLYNYTLGEQQFIPITLDQGLSNIELLKSIAYVTIFFLTLCLINTRDRIKTIVWTLFLTGFAQALYAILSIKGIVFWNPSPSSISGTYVNRNHLAGLLEMTIPLGIGLFFYKMNRSRPSVIWQQKLRNLSEFIMGRQSVILIMAVIMFGALLLTASRGGVFSMLVAFLLIGAYARIKRKTSHEAKLLPWGIGLVVLSSIWFGVEGLSDKIAMQGLDQHRLNVYRLSISMSADYLLVGNGNGLWEEGFTQYRDNTTGSGRFEHAHNDYLELLVGQGVIGVLILGGAIIYILVGMFSSYAGLRGPLANGVMFGVLVGCISICIHGVTDFNIQIPGNALILLVLMATGLIFQSKKLRDY